MSRVLITGSSDGLGLLAGRKLAEQGHAVTLHARSEPRAADAKRALPAAERVLVGDVSTLAGMRAVAEQANSSGAFDAVIHNVGVGDQEKRAYTADGLEHVFAINVLAPYVLTALVAPPKRLVYLTSGMHRGGKADLKDPQWKSRPWNGTQAYSDSKLFDVVLAFAVARRWRGVLSNAVDPGWVPTRMGGPNAPDDLNLGAATQVWLAVSEDKAAKTSGDLFHFQRLREPHIGATDPEAQDGLIGYCEKISGVVLTMGTQ